MDLKAVQEYLADKKGAAQDFPFGPEAMVFKVMGKMFALVALNAEPLAITLKCDPDHAEALRGMYEAVNPGYYMNKRHWNTVVLDNSIPDDHIFEMMDESYGLVVRGLKKADRQKLAG